MTRRLQSSPRSPTTGSSSCSFDRPNVRAVLRVDVESRETQEPGDKFGADSYDAYIWVYDLDPKTPLTYTLVLSGSSRLSRQYRTGVPIEIGSTGCPQASVFNDDVTCSTARGAPEAVFAAQDAQEDLDVIVGRVEIPRSVGERASPTLVQFQSRGRVNVTKGEKRFFALPRIGTSVAEGLPQDSAPVIDAPGRRYAAGLDLMITYKELHPYESLEGADPPPESRKPLTWRSSTSSSLAPTGVITDSRVERDNVRGVFVLGVLAGVVAAMVPLLFRPWWSAFSMSHRALQASANRRRRRASKSP